MVAARPAEVFAVVSPYVNPPSNATVERLSGGDAMGAVYQVRGRAFGAAFDFVLLVDVYAPPRSLGFSSVGQGTWFRVTYDIQPLGMGSQVTVNISVQTRRCWRLARPLIGPAVHRAARNAVAGAKANAERGGQPAGFGLIEQTAG